MSQPYDLTDAATLIQYAQMQDVSPTMQMVCAEMISGFSQALYNYTSRAPGCFNDQSSYTEFYDGNGQNELFLANAPVVSVASLQIGTGGGVLTIPASTGLNVFGYYIPRLAQSVKIRQGGGATTFTNSDWGAFAALPGWVFFRGAGNVQITYTAGYSTIPPDITMAALKQCKIWLDRMAREDQLSRVIPQDGSTNYAHWDWSPDVYKLVQPYRRMAQV